VIKKYTIEEINKTVDTSFKIEGIELPKATIGASMSITNKADITTITQKESEVIKLRENM
jgi:hypothetical protein